MSVCFTLKRLENLINTLDLPPHASIQITLDTYSHVAPGLQEAAADRFDKMVSPERENEAVEKFG
ncbi:hypothetical protein ES703_101668 [subsurface metagenome]